MTDNTLDAFLKELQTEDSTDAPFDLSLQATQKNRLIFSKVKAKNFRSVGQEFMELDFIKNKTTLIVSDDNGSGKSTLAVWAPYFALTGKPYSKREKIGALVNSQTRKDLVVELYLSTRGVDYKVIRGYKPAIFDIYKKEGGSWVKFEAPPSSSQQQANLEMLLGFDSKIIEKTMILGLDKFEPFIELDAPTRRSLIEKIWDLSVFSFMLEEAKKRFAIAKNQSESTSIEIDKTVDSLASERKNIEIAEGFKEDLLVAKKELEDLTNEIPLLEGRRDQARKTLTDLMTKLETEASELESKKSTIRQQIMDKHKDQGILLKAEVDEAELHAKNLVENAELSCEEEKNIISAELHDTKRKRDDELVEFDNSIEAELTAAKESVNSATEKAEAEAKAWLETEKIKPKPWFDYQITFDNLKMVQSVEKTDSLLAKNEEVLINKGKAEDLLDKCTEYQNLSDKIDSKLESYVEKLSEFEAAKTKLSETGDCPHCLQTIGEAALKLYSESIADKVTELEALRTEQLAEKTRITETLKTISAEILSLDEARKVLVKDAYNLDAELQEINTEINRLDIIISNEKTNYTNQLRNKYDEIIREYTQKAKDDLAFFENNTKTKRLEMSNKFESLLGAIDTKSQTVKAKIDTNVANAKLKASEASSAAKVAYDTWKATAAADLKEGLSDIEARLKSISTSKVEGEEHYTNLISEFGSKIDKTISDKSNKDDTVKSLESRISNTVTESNTKIDTLNVKSSELGSKHQALRTKMDITYYLINELGDSAAKTEIIKQYIPFLNAKINEYMAAMNMFVGFSMDEKFDVSFTSPDRKTQTVHSLSNGQKTRMNLAILFALRDVANLKNTTDSNLLVLDELLESLSEQGVREFVGMLRNKFSDYNIMVITQRKTEFCEYFDNTVCYGLRGGFTTVLEN